MTQMTKSNPEWKFSSILPLLGLVAVIIFSTPAKAEMLTTDIRPIGESLAAAITVRPVRIQQQVAATVVSLISVKPNTLTPGDRLVIRGRGFGSRQQDARKKNTIRFSRRGGWVTIPVQSWSDTLITSRPINQKPSGEGPLTMHFYRDNLELWSRNLLFGFHNPKILGYAEPTHVRPGDPVTVRVRDIPGDRVLRTEFGVSLMRGRQVLARVPFEAGSRRSDNTLVLHMPRSVEGRGLALALYRKSDSKIVSNLLPGLMIGRTSMASVEKAFGRLVVCNDIPMPFKGGPFIQNGQPLNIHAELKSNMQYYARYSPRLQVISDTRIKTWINSCLLVKDGIQIRFSYPDGSKSNWVGIQQSGVDRLW